MQYICYVILKEELGMQYICYAILKKDASNAVRLLCHLEKETCKSMRDHFRERSIQSNRWSTHLP